MLDIEKKTFVWYILGLANSGYQDASIGLVEDAEIKRVWDSITNNVTLPPIVAVMLTSEVFDYIDSRRNREDSFPLEYGIEYQQARKKFYFITNGLMFWEPIVCNSVPTWFVVLRKDTASLKHELLHVLEAILGKPPGTLTQNKEHLV
jgi:hypothetical protein